MTFELVAPWLSLIGVSVICLTLMWTFGRCSRCKDGLPVVAQEEHQVAAGDFGCSSLFMCRGSVI